jgi:putative addiction module component (TIGR02574 family)
MRLGIPVVDYEEVLPLRLVMTPLEQLGIDRLGIDERLDLIGQIWDTIARAPAEWVMPPSHAQELERRIAAADAEPDAAVPWEEVKARLKKRP